MLLACSAINPYPPQPLSSQVEKGEKYGDARRFKVSLRWRVSEAAGFGGGVNGTKSF
jgi:hypothetical protein